MRNAFGLWKTKLENLKNLKSMQNMYYRRTMCDAFEKCVSGLQLLLCLKLSQGRGCTLFMGVPDHGCKAQYSMDKEVHFIEAYHPSPRGKNRQMVKTIHWTDRVERKKKDMLKILWISYQYYRLLTLYSNRSNSANYYSFCTYIISYQFTRFSVRLGLSYK